MRFIDCRLMKIEDFSIKRGTQPTCALFYILDGSFSLTCDGCTRTVGKNELVSFPDNMEFERRMLSPITFYNVRLIDKEHILPRGVIKHTDHIRLIATLSYMSRLTKNDRELVEHYLKDIFIQIKTEQRLNAEPYDSIVSASEEYFEKNLSKKITLSEVCSHIGISSTGLIRHFKQSKGCTPMHHLTRLRVKRAELMLTCTDATLSEIAEECGFDNAFYCSSVFKKEKGMSPKSYRSLYRI